jgi:hypothetical protein
MSSTTELINNTFGGIRRKNSSFSSEHITCSDCQNIELYNTGINSGIGIRTTSGNISITSKIPNGETIIGMFKSVQDGNVYFIVYTESATAGKLYSYNMVTDTLTTLFSSLKVTGKACGCDIQQGWRDYFVFSNGIDIKYIYSTTDTHSALLIETDANVKLVDPDGRKVSGLGIVEFDNRLWIFNNNVLWYSQKGDCRIFNYIDASTITSSGYIELVKSITAIYPYLGSLAVFYRDSSVLVKQDETTLFRVEDDSPGGCASYNSLVYHGTDLYFYDDTKKGVFSFQQIVNGDKTLTDNVAEDIQEELLGIKSNKVDQIRVLSVITKDRNEVWFLVPISENDNYSIVMIYDYTKGEWIKRKCQKINAITMINGSLYSGGKSIYEEYKGNNFNGEYIESFYNCSILNLGKDNSLKITKFPPRIAVDASFKNNFFVKYVKNYNVLKLPKIKEIKGKSLKNIMVYDSDNTYDTEFSYQPTTVSQVLKLPSSNFKALEISFYTEKAPQDFCIKSLEMTKIKVKDI